MPVVIFVLAPQAPVDVGSAAPRGPVDGGPPLARPQGQEWSVEMPAGGALLDACDETGTPIRFSCRSGTCGTCRVRVLEGHDAMAPPAPDEMATLAALGAPSSIRLACRARLYPGSGTVRLLFDEAATPARS